VLQDVIVQKPVGSGARGTWVLRLALTLVTGVTYVSSDVDSVKGLLQRAGQVASDVWLVPLGWWASESGEDAGEPVGDGGGDRVSVS
jgi:hypothetical protein